MNRAIINTKGNVWRRLMLFVFAVAFICIDLSATHIVGGNMTYRKVGPDLYEITFTMRRDCELGSPEAQFDDPAVVAIYGATGGLQFNLGNFGKISMPYMADDTLNTFIMSDCGFEGAQVCVHETRYIQTVRLPYRAGGYILAYQRCCRNSSLNNVLDPLSTGATYTVSIGEDALLNDNSSPVFKQWPDVYICANEELVFDHGAIDADGDSLVYSLCVPRTGATPDRPKPQPASAPPYDPIEFQPPYSLDNLMGGTPLRIDPNTGELTAEPNTVGQFVVGICVEEYRDGVLIGTVNRDFQYNVRVCSDPPTADFSSPAANCEGLTIPFTNESISTTAFQWNFNYPDTDPAFISTDTDPVFTFPQTGSYQVELIAIRNSDQCSDTLIRTVNVFDADYIADFSTVVSECAEDGSVDVTLTDQSTISVSGVNTIDWNWTLVQGMDTVRLAGEEITINLDQDSFLVLLEVEADNGCISQVERSVDFDDIRLIADFNVSIDGCTEDDVIGISLNDLTAQNNPNFNISTLNWTVTSATGSNTYMGTNVVAEIPREDFTVTLDVNATNGCFDSEQKSYEIEDFISEAEFSFLLSGCDDDNALQVEFSEEVRDTLGFAVVDKFEWSIDGQMLDGATVSFLQQPGDTAQAMLTVTYDNGCTASIAKTIIADDLRPQLLFDFAGVACQDDESVDILFSVNDSDTQGFDFSNVVWNIGAVSDISSYSGDSVTVTVPKDSMISVTLMADFENGCSDQITELILPGPFATLEFVSDTLVICPNESRELIVGGNPDLTYTYSPETGLDLTNPWNPIVNITADQEYQVTVSDGLCEVSGSIFVDILESIDLEIMGDDFTCDGSVSLMVTGGVGEGEYEWAITPGFNNIVQTGDKLETIFGGDMQTFFVRWRGEVCSANPAQITVVNQTPDIEIFEPFEVCAGDTFTYTTLNSIPEHDVTIQWDPHPFLLDGLNTLTPTVGVPIGTTESFELSFLVTNQFGCEDRDTITFDIGENPEVDFTFAVENCEDYTVCFDVVGSYNGFPSWDFGDPNTTSDTSPLPSVCYTYPGPGTYTVTLSNLSLVCAYEDVVKEITLNGSLDLFDIDSTEACINEDFVVSLPDAAQGLEFSWCDIDGNEIGTEEDLTIFIDGDKQVILKVNDENGCPFQDTFNIEAFDFDYEVIMPDIYCFGTNVMVSINVEGGLDYIYNWSPADCVVSGQGTSEVTIDVNEAKTLTVTVTHPSLGCVLEESITIDPVSIEFELGVDPDTEIFLGSEVEIFVIDPEPTWTYLWSTGETTSSIIVSPEEATTYSVTVTDENGCTGEADTEITIDRPDCEEDVYLPNAFTPNGDNVNDVFRVRSNFVTDMELLIYNRWGEQVFRSTDINFGWDGTYKGEPLSPDAYAYYLRAMCTDGVEIKRQGNVSLLK